MGILPDFIPYCVLVSLGTRNDQNGVFHRTGASGRDVAADDGREGTMEGLAILLGVFIRLLIPVLVLLLVGEGVRRISHDPLIM
jgi:hypothetical protein